MKKHILIIGGGINGAGIARDAAMRGYDVTLFEKGDFCSGTSWASSKLIHGGLRYLEHFEFGLVRESLREREILLRICPYNVHPLDLTIPVYQHSPHPLIALRAGLTVYDVLSYDKSLPNHVTLRPEEIEKKIPGIDTADLLGGLSYSDCQCPFPERLVLANLQSAVHHGAKIFNYHQAAGFLKQGNRVVGLRVRNLQTGDEKNYEADFVINAAGPWVDAILRTEVKKQQPLLGGTKGSHIVIKNSHPALTSAVYVNARADGRPFFILPWREQYLLIGTTDIRFEGHLESLYPSAEEIDYLLTEFNALFPSAHLNRSSILFSFSGVRPLPYTEEDATAAITRKHFIVDHAERDGLHGLISLVGGKLTTYRNASEEIVDFVVSQSNFPVNECRTAEEVLPGGEMDDLENYIESEYKLIPSRWKISEQSFNHLVNLYGTDYKKIIDACKNDPDGFKPVCPHVPDIKAQIIYSARSEWAVTLADILLRRTPAGMGDCLGLCNLDEVAQWVGQTLGWDQTKIQQEKARYRNYVEVFLLHHKTDGAA